MKLLLLALSLLCSLRVSAQEPTDSALVWAPPNNREALQAIKKAQGFIEEKRYGEGFAILEKALQAPPAYYRQGNALQNSHHEITKYLKGASSEIRTKWEESLMGAPKRLFDAAVESGSDEQFGEVLRRYPVTPEANAARYFLARSAMDHGQSDYAKRLLEELVSPAGDYSAAAKEMLQQVKALPATRSEPELWQRLDEVALLPVDKQKDAYRNLLVDWDDESLRDLVAKMQSLPLGEEDAQRLIRLETIMKSINLPPKELSAEAFKRGLICGKVKGTPKRLRVTDKGQVTLQTGETEFAHFTTPAASSEMYDVKESYQGKFEAAASLLSPDGKSADFLQPKQETCAVLRLVGLGEGPNRIAPSWNYLRTPSAAFTPTALHVGLERYPDYHLAGVSSKTGVQLTRHAFLSGALMNVFHLRVPLDSVTELLQPDPSRPDQFLLVGTKGEKTTNAYLFKMARDPRAVAFLNIHSAQATAKGYIILSEQQNVFTWDRAGTRLTVRAPAGTKISSYAVSPSQEVLAAFDEQGQPQLFKLEAGSDKRASFKATAVPFPKSDAAVQLSAFSPEGRYFAFFRADGQLCTVKTAATGPVQPIQISTARKLKQMGLPTGKKPASTH